MITLSVLNCYSPNFQGFVLMKNALNNQLGMLGDMFLWLVANLKQGVIYCIKQTLPPNISAGSVRLSNLKWLLQQINSLPFNQSKDNYVVDIAELSCDWLTAERFYDWDPF